MTQSQPSSEAQALRALDASLNRAREGVRVVEDYLRFGQDNPWGVTRCKALRNQLADIARAIGEERLLQARSTATDTGRAVTSSAEATRLDARDVAQTNLKRVQEALRSIEEFLKSLALTEAAFACESSRYQTYILERELSLLDTLGAERRKRLLACNLMLIISESGCKLPAPDLLNSVLRGGVCVIQLREKNGSDRERFAALHRMVASLQQGEAKLQEELGAAYSQPLILINDRCDFALELGADGVHLGQDDAPPQLARNLLGQDALIGMSTHNIDELEEAEREGIADYFGAGAMFATTTKQVEHQGGPAWGAQATLATELPVFCIGGVSATNLPTLIEHGVKRVAISSHLCQHDQPERAATELRALLGKIASQ